MAHNIGLINIALSEMQLKKKYEKLPEKTFPENANGCIPLKVWLILVLAWLE